MNEQRVEPQVRLVNAIDRDLIDAKINLNLIERLTEQNDHPQTRAFNDEELQAIIRSCTYAVVLNLTKTLEKPNENPERETYNLQSLIEQVCHEDDLEVLKAECGKIRGDARYRELVKYRHNIIAHRNIEYKDYLAIEDKFTECRDYLLENKGHIGTLVDQINDLQMKIKTSRIKKLGFIDNGAEIFAIEISPEDVGQKKEIKFAYSTKY